MKARQAAEYMKQKGSTAAGYAKESAHNIHESHKDGTLKDKTKENAHKAKAAIGSFGTSMFTRMDSYMNSGPSNNNNQ